MQKRRARILRISKVVVAVLFGGFLVSATTIRVTRWRDARTRKRLGLATDGLNVVFKSPLSPSKVKETALDTNGDHEHDQGSVQIREGERWRCDYFLDDLDFDGTPDTWTVGIGEFQAGFDLIDDDNDAKPDRLAVMIADFSDMNLQCHYDDFDLDGIFDAMSRSERSERLRGMPVTVYVLLDAAWVGTSTQMMEPSGLRGARIVREDGSEDRVVFDGGKWQVVE